MQNELLNRYLEDFFGKDITAFLNARPEQTAIRVNTLRLSAESLALRLENLGVPFRKISFNQNGFILPQDSLPLSHTIDFFSGNFQYQGVASQLPVLALKPEPGERVLDMAAAPGSKSTQLAALMKNKGILYLNDVSRKRLQPLNANTQKAGVFNHVLLYAPGERLGNLFPNYFDKVLLDAPCSALGTLAAHPEIKGWWSEEKMALLTGIQQRLLISAYKALRPGGEMVYSTCSFTPRENEMRIQELLDTYPMEIIPIELKGIEDFYPGMTRYKNNNFNESMQYARRVLPHVHGMEGFFVIKLRKPRAHQIHAAAKTATFTDTLTADHPDVAGDLREISDQWGIPYEIWQEYRYLRTRRRIWLTNRENVHIPREGFTSVGLLLAEKKLFMWKLFNQSARLLQNVITTRRLSLPRETLKLLFASGTAPLVDTPDGYYALEWERDLPGSLYVDKNIAHIKLPHRFRLIV